MKTLREANAARFMYDHPTLGLGGDLFGFFKIPYSRGVVLYVMVNDAQQWPLGGIPWEHVSVSLPERCPTWDEMDYVKRTFWHDHEAVMQLHVPRDQHLSFHPYCLHLWRPVGVEIPLPNPITVAPQSALVSR